MFRQLSICSAVISEFCYIFTLFSVESLSTAFRALDFVHLPKFHPFFYRHFLLDQVLKTSVPP